MWAATPRDTPHRDSGEEGEWRPWLLYADPLGHHVTATLFIARFMRNDMIGDHYEMIGKVAFGGSRVGGDCMGCVGANIATVVQRKGCFLVPAPSPPPHTFYPSRGENV